MTRRIHPMNYRAIVLAADAVGVLVPRVWRVWAGLPPAPLNLPGAKS